MGRYSLRNGVMSAPEAEVKHLYVSETDERDGVYGAPYIKLQPVADSGSDVYLFVGTAGHLMFSSTAPVGTSGTFADIGTRIGTVG